MDFIRANRISIAFLVCAVALLAVFQSTRHFAPIHRVFLKPPQNLELLSLGYDDVVADVLWIRVLQDFDCRIEPKPGEPIRGTCEKGWAHSMVRAIVDLSPRFKMAHVAGGQLLSVVVNDPEGAADIYETAIKRYDWDFQIPLRAAYTYMIELKRPDRAAELLAESGRRGGPTWVYSLAARLLSKEGQLELARTVLKEAIDSGRMEYRELIEKRLQEVEKGILADPHTP